MNIKSHRNHLICTVILLCLFIEVLPRTNILKQNWHPLSFPGTTNSLTLYPSFSLFSEGKQTGIIRKKRGSLKLLFSHKLNLDHLCIEVRCKVACPSVFFLVFFKIRNAKQISLRIYFVLTHSFPMNPSSNPWK